MRYIFKFPDIGEGLEEGKIIEWYVEKGQSISSGDPLVKMETDKVVTDIPSPKSGVIAQRFGTIGETVKVGNALVEIDIAGVEGTEAREIARHEPQKAADAIVEEKGFGVVGTIEVAGNGSYLPAGNEGMEKKAEASTQQRKVLSTPVARAMAKELGLDINSITGTGPAGRVTIRDVEKQKHKPATGSHAPLQKNLTDEVEIMPLSQIRKTIAKNMLRSKQNAAHMSVMDEIEVSRLVEYRTALNARLEGIKLSYLPFIIKAVAIALKKHPVLNAELDLDNERIIYKKAINLGLAMDTEDGLVVPVIRNADRKGLQQLATEIAELATKARERKLSLSDLKDGTFSITSYGSIGGYFAVPVINYPQSAILGIGRIADKPVIKDNAVVPGKVMPISMSVDHRIVDGGEVARFLNEVIAMLKEPLLIWAQEGVEA